MPLSSRVWMYQRRTTDGHQNPEFEQNVEDFLNFDDEITSNHPNITDHVLEMVREKGFVPWLRTHVLLEPEVDRRIYELAQGPHRMVKCYNGYFVNGFKFHTRAYGESKTTFNSGVFVKGSTYNDHECDFYGMVEEVIELSYFGYRNKIVLFKCEWYDTTQGVQVHPQYGLVEVKHKSKLASSDPFILASQAQQVYYTTYPSKKRKRLEWWAVCKTKAKRRFEMTKALEDDKNEDDDVYQEDELFTVNVEQDLELNIESHTLVVNGENEEVDYPEMNIQTEQEENYEDENMIHEEEEQESEDSFGHID